MKWIIPDNIWKNFKIDNTFYVRITFGGKTIGYKRIRK